MNSWIEGVNKERSKAKAAGMDEEIMDLPDEFVESVQQRAPEGQVTFVFTDVESSTKLWEKV
jgi:class 3 adenylate cyclase